MDDMTPNHNEQAELFKKNGFIFIKDFISKEFATFLYNYTLMKRQSMKTMIDRKILEPKNILGTIHDLQVEGAFCSYGDPAMETLQLGCMNKINKILNIEVCPTYSFVRIYFKGNELEKHLDRDACEISVSVCLGYDYTNAPKDYQCGLFLGDKEITLDIGDAVIYKGTQIEHWREPFQGTMQCQLFMHYNNTDGPFRLDNIYDKRPHLGLPPEEIMHDIEHRDNY